MLVHRISILSKIIMEKDLEIFKQAILHLDSRYTDDEWNYIQSGLKIQMFKPREFFIEAGKKKHELGFITSGLVRAYYINDAGQDITVMFSKEREYVTDYPSLLTQKPSRYYFQCLEPTTIIVLPYQHLKQGYEKYPRIDRHGRLVAEEVIKRMQKRIDSFQFDQAEQRYIDFCSENPELFNRISLTHLSSFLGIERPSLSRIRKKIAGL
jgi:CRP/FNR family transcriptional regulator